VNADTPAPAVILAADASGYTVAVTYCPCSAVVGECDCDEMVSDWLHRFEQMHRAGVAR
jgi:hypothetical protein